jgi:hypothetical protein
MMIKQNTFILNLKMYTFKNLKLCMHLKLNTYRIIIILKFNFIQFNLN